MDLAAVHGRFPLPGGLAQLSAVNLIARWMIAGDKLTSCRGLSGRAPSARWARAAPERHGAVVALGVGNAIYVPGVDRPGLLVSMAMVAVTD
jgi:hypothetical protein